MEALPQPSAHSPSEAIGADTTMTDRSHMEALPQPSAQPPSEAIARTLRWLNGVSQWCGGIWWCYGQSVNLGTDANILGPVGAVADLGSSKCALAVKKGSIILH